MYRAVDKLGQTVDFLLTVRCDAAAARRFFERAIDLHDVPQKITLELIHFGRRLLVRFSNSGDVSLFPYHRPDDPAVGEPVAQRIAQTQDAGTPIRAVMLDRLGSHVWHGSPAEASSVLEELEETARLWPLTRAASLDPKQIDELRRQFGAAW